MAVVHLKSTQITNRDATPRVMNSAGVDGGIMRGFVGTLELTAADDIGSTYRFATVPSNAVMHSLRIYCDDVGNAGDLDIGIYQTTANGGAVVDADVFAAAVDVNAAALNGTDVLNESAVTAWGLEDAEKPLWQALGLSSDPGIDYDIVATATEAVQTGGTVTLRGTYCL